MASIQFLTSLAAVSISSALVSCQPVRTSNILASVLQVQGNATVLHGNNETVLAAGSTLAAGDKLHTGQSSSVAISLLPGVLIESEPSTTVGIGELGLLKDGNETADPMKARWATVRLEQGKMRAYIARHINRCRVTIETPSGMLSARRDAVFSLEAGRESSRIICVQGKIRWRAATSVSPVVISKDRFYETTQNGSITHEPGKIVDAVVEAEFEATIGTAGLLEQLQNQARNAPAPWRRLRGK